MPSEVFFAPAKRIGRVGLYQGFERVLKASGLAPSIPKDGVVAIKMHMGERGGARYIRPTFVAGLVRWLKERGVHPVVTDSTVLYTSKRKRWMDYIETARMNGFVSESIGCPVIIGDGLRGEDVVGVKVKKPLRLRDVEVIRSIWDADFLISLAHLTLHVEFPVAGSLKNVGMGGVSQATKSAMHCTKSQVKHVGVQEATLDGASAIFSTFKDRHFCINMAIDVTADCDCLNKTDIPVVTDIGILASDDPVAVDKASFDLFEKTPIYPGSLLEEKIKAGGKGDRLKLIYPRLNPSLFWRSVESAGIGNLSYDLVDVIPLS